MMSTAPQFAVPRLTESLYSVAEALRLLSPDVAEWVLADFEFATTPGSIPKPHHLCAIEIYSGKRHTYNPAELAALKECPFPSGHGLIAFAVDAELSCYLALGWELPTQVLDQRVEHMMRFRNVSGTKDLGVNLEEMLAFYGVSHSFENKKEIQKECGGTTVFTEERSRQVILPYCQADADAELDALAREVSLYDQSSLFRGRYMRAVAMIHHRGIPADEKYFKCVRNNAATLRLEWVRKYDPNFEIFDEEGSIKRSRWEAYLEKRGKLALWPKTPKSKVASHEDAVLRDMVAADNISPEIAELFYTVNLLKNFKLYIGEDGRNRVGWFNAYGTTTSRNAQKAYIFMMAKWVRSLMKPAPGMGMAYVDWNSMEVGVGAWLSRDPKLLEAYASGDAHMYLAKASGMVPQDATKDAKTSPYACGPRCGHADECLKLPRCEEFRKHKDIRAQFKICDLAAMYFATVSTLVKKGLSKDQAKMTLRFHHDIYSVFWEWIVDQIEAADVAGQAETVFGWKMAVNAEAEKFNQRSVGNFFVQANSAEIMHLGAILAVEAGVPVVAIVHDAFLIEAPIEDMGRQVGKLKECMDEASRVVLDDFVLGVDGHTPDKWVLFPDRYLDERGEDFWKEVQPSLEALCKEKNV